MSAETNDFYTIFCVISLVLFTADGVYHAVKLFRLLADMSAVGEDNNKKCYKSRYLYMKAGINKIHPCFLHICACLIGLLLTSICSLSLVLI